LRQGRGCRGLAARVSLAASESGRPSGLLGVDAGFGRPANESRRGSAREGRRRIGNLKRAAEVADGAVRTVSVSGRESDCRDIVARQAELDGRVGPVVPVSRRRGRLRGAGWLSPTTAKARARSTQWRPCRLWRRTRSGSPHAAEGMRWARSLPVGMQIAFVSLAALRPACASRPAGSPTP